MANYCYNWASFSGDKETLDSLEAKFKAFPENEPITFSDFCDTFFTEAHDKKEDAHEEAYYYGTRWWHFEVERPNDSHLIVSGNSAWSPPSEFLRRISMHYAVKIRLEYEESGADFGGYSNFDNGAEEDHCYPYNEWRYLENPEGFFSDIEDHTEVFDTFEEYKEHILDEFTTELTEAQLKEIREEFNQHKNN